MDISEEYRDEVERIGESTENLISRKRASKLKSLLDQFLPFALLSLTLVIFLGFFVPVTQRLEIYVTYLNWGVILYFAARLVVEFRLSNHRERFIQTHWLDFLLVVPAFSVVREAKLLQAVGEMELFEEETVVSAAFFKEAGVAAQITKIAKLVKRSIGL